MSKAQSHRCAQCGAENPRKHRHCAQCGALLETDTQNLRADASLHPAKKVSSTAVAAGSFLAGLAILFAVSHHSPEDKPPAPYTGPDSSVYRLAKVKALWEQGAAAKQRRAYAAAASAWQDALEIEPRHPGIQDAIDKLPVAVSYLIEPPKQAQGAKLRCTLSFLNEKQRRVRLRNIVLPWRMTFLARKGQPLSLSATSDDPQYPLAASILIGASARRVGFATSLTPYLLGYAGASRCAAKADYQGDEAHGAPDASLDDEWETVQGEFPMDDTQKIQTKLNQMFGKDTQRVVSGATVINKTDILLIVVPQAWQTVSSDDQMQGARIFYEVWVKTRHPRFDKQASILLVDDQGHRLGGSSYADASRLWVRNQGFTDTPLRDLTSLAQVATQSMPSSLKQVGEQSSPAPNGGFDIPSLLGQNIDGLIAVLGQPAERVASEGIALFIQPEAQLQVTYKLSGGKITQYFLIPNWKDSYGETGDLDRLMKSGNLRADDPLYRAEPDKSADPGQYTGVIVTPY